MQIVRIRPGDYPYFVNQYGVDEPQLSGVWQAVYTENTGSNYDLWTISTGDRRITCYCRRLQIVDGGIALSVAGDGPEYHTEQSLIERLSALPDEVHFAYHRLDNPSLVHYHNG